MCSYGNHASSSLLNLPRDECKRILRRLELEAYCSTVSALRAQGDLTNEKKLLLQNLQDCLKISAERHGAEVRRAVNDQKLTTIANNLSGPDVSSKWMREGRRLVAIMPRLVPHTAFTATANSTAVLQAERNKTLRDSGCAPGSVIDGLVQGTQGISRGGDHSNRQVVVEASGSFSSQETICLSSSHFPTGSCREMEIGAGHEVKPSWQPYISACNDSTFEPVYVDSSKAGSLVTGGNLPDLCMNGTFAVGTCSREASELDGFPIKRRKYDFSDVSVNSPSVSLTAGINASQPSFHGAIRGVQQLVPSSSSSMPSRPSIKLTMAKPVPRLTYPPKPGGAPQKVIIVSGAGVSSATTICAPPQTIFPQKSVVVSVMKTSTSVPLPTVVTSFTMNPVTPSVGNLTVANSFVGGGLSGSQIVRSSPSAPFAQVTVQNTNALISNPYHSNPYHAPPALRPRLKSLATRPRTPQILQASSLNHSGFNVSGALSSANSVSSGYRHLKTVPLKTTLQIGRPDNMKKISVSPAATKILPKPMMLSSSLSGSSATPTTIMLTRPSGGTSNQCQMTSAKVTAGSLVQGNMGGRVVFSEPGSISHNQGCEVNLDATKTRPTLVINRIVQDETGQHQIPVNVLHNITLNSVSGELTPTAAAVQSSAAMQTTAASGPAVHQASYNTAVYRITTSSPLVHPMYPLVSTAGNSVEMRSSVEMEENDAEDLSAISALLSLKMFPAGIEQISPASPIDDVAETVNDNNDADETLSSQVEFTEEMTADSPISFAPQLTLETVADPVVNNTDGCHEEVQTCTVNCHSTMNSDRVSATTNGQERDTVSSIVGSLHIPDSSFANLPVVQLASSAVQVAKPSDDKGPLDFRIEPDLHSNCTAINSHPVIVTHVDANHLDSKQEADVNQFSGNRSVYNEATEMLQLSDNSQPVDHTTSPRSSRGDGGDHLAPSPNKVNDLGMSPNSLGKRKRRPPPRSPIEHEPLLSGWFRPALTLLTRVMKFRNPQNERGKTNAASWFNFPVDAKEVPDYYDIVHRPMDFSTIKQNLKTGAYDDWSGFHSDMLLVRDNCHLYNPADTDVRHDCDLVFDFYQQEYVKALALWKQQQHLSSNSFSTVGHRLRADHDSSDDHAVH